MLFGQTSTAAGRSGRRGDEPDSLRPAGGLPIGARGMQLLLLSLMPPFVVLVILAFWFRARTAANGLPWPPPGAPPIPVGVWISTVILLLTSATMQLGVAASRRGEPQRLRRTLVVAALLGAAFLAAQALNVWVMFAGGIPALGRQYLGLLAFFAVFHALHVLAGVVSVSWLVIVALLGRPLSRMALGVRVNAWYWHFVDLAWIVVLTAVLIPAATPPLPPVH